MERMSIEDLIVGGMDKLWGLRISHKASSENQGVSSLEVRNESGEWVGVGAEVKGEQSPNLERQARAIRQEIERKTGRGYAIGWHGDEPAEARGLESGEAVRWAEAQSWKVRRGAEGEIVCEIGYANHDGQPQQVAHPHGNDAEKAREWLHRKALAQLRDEKGGWGPEAIAAAGEVKIETEGSLAREPRESDGTITRVGVIRTSPATYEIHGLDSNGDRHALHEREDSTRVQYADPAEALRSARKIADNAEVLGGHRVEVDLAGEWPPGSGQAPGLEDVSILEAGSREGVQNGSNSKVIGIDVDRNAEGSIELNVHRMDAGGNESTHRVPSPTGNDAQAAKDHADAIANRLWSLAPSGNDPIGRPTVRDLGTARETDKPDEPSQEPRAKPLDTSEQGKKPEGASTPTSSGAAEADMWPNDWDKNQDLSGGSSQRFPSHPDYPLTSSWVKGPGDAMSPHAVLLEGAAGVRPAHLLKEPVVHQSGEGVYRVWVRDEHGGARHALAGSATRNPEEAVTLATKVHRNLDAAGRAHTRVQSQIGEAKSKVGLGKFTSRALITTGLGGALVVGALVATGGLASIAMPLAGALLATSVGGFMHRRVTNQEEKERKGIVDNWRHGAQIDAVRKAETPGPDNGAIRTDFTAHEAGTQRNEPGFKIERDWNDYINEAQKAQGQSETGTFEPPKGTRKQGSEPAKGPTRKTARGEQEIGA